MSLLLPRLRFFVAPGRIYECRTAFCQTPTFWLSTGLFLSAPPDSQPGRISSIA